MTQHYITKTLPESEQPYELCERFGPEGLTDAQLLAVILRTGTKEKTSVELAYDILQQCGRKKGLQGLYYQSQQDFMRIKGVGRVKAIQLRCLCELSRRISKAVSKESLSFQKPSSIAQYVMEDMRYLTKEQMRVLYLDTKCALISDRVVSVGTVNSSIANPREIMIEALKLDAVSLILIHNHPSGDPSPSREDINTTKRMLAAGECIGISVLDHIIIGNGVYISLKEQGLI
ncbi:MAG: DNA repair protein RadC [Lachnospiraceae bacterium]